MSLTPDTATRRQFAEGLALTLLAPTSNQIGAALGAKAFPMIGPVGVVAVRQIITAVVLGLIARPRFRSFGAREWAPVLALAIIFSVMNLTLYAAIERIGLGLAVTLEFLGPLAVAIAASRKVIDLACAILAAIGVVVLTHPGPSSDLIGIGLAMIAATMWAGYILVNRSIGQVLPGLQGPAAGAIVASIAWVPIAAWWFATHPPTAAAMLLAAVCGVLASAIPYGVDVLALRRVPTGLFSTLASINPVLAAVVGLVLLGQALTWYEWLGMGLIVLANVLVSLRHAR